MNTESDEMTKQKRRAARREQQRQTCLQHRPWEHSTGPRTAAGKARSAANGNYVKSRPGSYRQLRAWAAKERAWLKALADERAESMPDTSFD